MIKRRPTPDDYAASRDMRQASGSPMIDEAFNDAAPSA